MISHLPCKKCGSSLAIIKGSIAKCPYCGAKTFYMESIYSFKYYLAEILNLTSMKHEKEVKDEELERRKSSIKSFYHKLNFEFKEYRHLIITKLDDINIDPLKLFNLIRSAGNFEIIIEKYLLTHITNDKIKKEFREYRDTSFIINKSLLGLYYSYLAKISYYLEDCSRYYDLAAKNYQNIVDYYNITQFEDNSIKTNQMKDVYIILAEFTVILKGILNKNPKYFSKKLENLINKLNRIKEYSILVYNLYTQIERIYQLERDTSILLEKVKVDNPFSSTEPPEVDIIFNTDESVEKLTSVSKWIKDISEKYQKYQRNLLKLHSGKLIKYLESYRSEFINVKNKNVEKFNDLLENMIIKAFDTYNSESIEVLNTLSDFLHHNLFNENIIERFEIEHKDLIYLDDLLKKFINNILTKPLIRDLESDYYKKLISLISGKHSEFDKHILNYVNHMLREFQEIRRKKVLSLEEQRNQFSLELKPNLQKLIDLSFNLDKIALPYPLFIDIKVQNNKLKVNNSEVIKFIIENPNLTDIKDIKIYFFMPNSFQSKLKYTSIKKLKANERRIIKTKLIPKKSGIFLYMVMVEYQHINKTFWMPSTKLKLTVEEAKEDYIHSQYLKQYNNIFNNGFEVSRVLMGVRSVI
ncbi:MAG: hypothetical protein JSV23_04800 [Promethearchaeota archaeon]|nr:MAG: hypothetical protein JSV23_04800 [Candidatus Lokiarchaeota archaeon]